MNETDKIFEKMKQLSARHSQYVLCYLWGVIKNDIKEYQKELFSSAIEYYLNIEKQDANKEAQYFGEK